VAKNKTSGIKNAITAVLIVFFSMALPLTAPAEDGLPAFNPRAYKSKDIKFRGPEADKPWISDELINAARGYLVLGYIPESLDCYKSLIAGGSGEKLESEYAYALSLGGYYEPAMLYLDSAHMTDPSGTQPYYYAGMVFMFAGYGDIAGNFWKIARGNNDFFSNMASDTGRKKNIGVLSYAGLDRDFIKELDCPVSDGVVVLTVYPGPEKLRTELSQNDVIMKIDGKTIGDIRDLEDIIKNKPIGGELDIIVWRKGLKRDLKVKVNSGDDAQGLPSMKSSSMAPPEKAKTRLARALSMFVEKKYFAAILIFRGLIEDYPDWVLPYLGYALALEKAGAFQCGQKAVEQAIIAAEKNKEAKAQLKDKLKQLKNMPVSDQDNWRQEQTVKTFAEKPAQFSIGFGGARLIIGGSSGLRASLSGRFGVILDSGIDVSLNLSLDTSSGVSIGVNAIQRYFMGDSFSLNYGGSISFNTAGPALSGGLLGGISWYLDSKKSSSLDTMLNIQVSPGSDSAPSGSIYIGVTRYM
jgi:tetratricopeptide (TPR) repeat protein